jgi:RNA polymerase sigma-70 factor (ECF subfamily)
MNVRALASGLGTEHAPAGQAGAERSPVVSAGPAVFEREFTLLFDAHFVRIFRYLDRLSGDADVAADAVQEAFVRLFRRGAVPDDPAAWLITVALNQFRNAVSQRNRRLALLASSWGHGPHSDPPPSPADTAESNDDKRRVRQAIDLMPARDRELLLLRAEGYSYREIAVALRLHEASVGTLLARARDAFRARYEEATDAR